MTISIAGGASLYVVRKSITVNALIEHAFRVLTGERGKWWRLDTHHIGKVAPTTAVIEPARLRSVV